jgi:hypothetical protein
MDRRSFLKFVGGGITFSITKPIVSKVPIPATPAPATTDLGKELVKPLLIPEGWHKVKILDVDLTESKATGKPYFSFTFETVDTQRTLTQMVSPEFPHDLLKMLKKADIPIIGDSVELNELIGKVIDVKVEQRQFHNRFLNSVSQ